MKGPGGRFKYDLRRHWQCPVCHARRWTGGHVVTLRCPRCAAHDPPRESWMQLVETPAKPSPPKPPSTSGASDQATE
jgi:hypothetical protein